MDHEGDGMLELVLTGQTSPYTIITTLVLNQGQTDDLQFQEHPGWLPGVSSADMDWGDYDADGDLDLLGTDRSGSIDYSLIYQNNCSRPNQPPSAPGSPTAELDCALVCFNWTAGTDYTTPAAGLSYNLRLGVTPGGGEVRPALSRSEDGKRQVFRRGPIQGLSHWLDLGPTRRPQEWPLRYWALQSIDAGFTDSPFTAEQSFVLPVDYLEVLNQPELPPDGLLLWEASTDNTLESYQVQVAGDPAFTAPLIDELLPPETSRELWWSARLDELNGHESLQDGGVYFWRMRPHYGDCDFTVFTALPPSSVYRTASPPSPVIQIDLADGLARLSWPPVDPPEIRHYDLYHSEDAYAPFPAGWQICAQMLVDTTWTDPQPPQGRRCYRVTVLEE